MELLIRFGNLESRDMTSPHPTETRHVLRYIQPLVNVHLMDFHIQSIYTYRALVNMKNSRVATLRIQHKRARHMKAPDIEAQSQFDIRTNDSEYRRFRDLWA